MRGGDRKSLGLWGEELASRYLAEKGYRTVCRRYRCREGELDLVTQGQGFLCFVEVKLRKDDRMGKAREFVTPRKQEKLRIAAQRYLLEHPTDLQPRFDVVEVYAPYGEGTKDPVICLWPNAF